MQVESLTRQQTRKIYNDYLRKDFPDCERRPLHSILRAMRRGIYDCFALTEDGQVMAYAFFVRLNEDFLLDYFAAVEGKRGSGIGTEFLGLLQEKLRTARYVLAEVEDPDAAQNEKEREERIRRIRFYERSGFMDTGVRARTFGVEYRIIGLQTGKAFDREQICTIYTPFYGRLMPEFICRKEVQPYLPEK